MSLFIQNAYAAGPAPAGGGWQSFIIFPIMLLVFYFMIWRPQSKRQKEHKTMIDSIKEGSEIMFAGGLMGKVKSLSEEYAVVSLNDKNHITIQKSSIIAVVPAGTIDGVNNT